MSTTIRKVVHEEPRLRVIEWHWSDDWNTLTPWSLDGEILPYFCRHVKDYGDGKILTTWIIGPLARFHAEIVDQ